jgi:hypothetical protein
MSYTISRLANKVIVKILADPSVPSDIDGFSNEYRSLLYAQQEAQGDNQPTLVVLYDLRNVTLSFWKPKLALCKRVVAFFSEMADVSEHTVIATSSLLSPKGNVFMVAAIQKVVAAIPGHTIPTFVSSDVHACKAFLKNMEETGRVLPALK